jgi:hypothetical protein
VPGHDKYSKGKGDPMNDKDLIALCDEYFTGYWQQDYAGAPEECVFCGAEKESTGKCDHEKWCPVPRYAEIRAKETT